MLNQKDLELLQKRGISAHQVEEQQNQIIQGSKALSISEAASINNGIIPLDKEQIGQLADLWNVAKEQWSFEKFVPASGAATRMFKDLYSHLQEGKENPQSRAFLDRLREFPFYNDLQEELAPLQDDPQSDLKILEYLLEGKPSWGTKPKGVLPFHKTEDQCRTAMGEQLSEGRGYAQKDGKVSIHFTISPDHQELFRQTEESEKSAFTDSQFDISYSFQQPSTDTIALDHDNRLFRNDQNELLFRPGGHGALIHNLDQRPSDILFIKNIDNVQQQSFQGPTVDYFQALAGLLIETRQEQRRCYEVLCSNPEQADDHLEQVERLCGIKFTQARNKISAKTLITLLDRPLRICGMVKNQGEPGGGPFWVRDSKGFDSLQILESAQIDLRNEENKRIFQRSSHFNPVFMACLKRDFQGKAYSLLDFVDQDSYFIAHKTLNGRELKALELPGLWNGAMADWSTLFVEIPPECFTPVKTVNDLLREAHC